MSGDAESGLPVSGVCIVCFWSLCKQITELRARWRERPSWEDEPSAIPGMNICY